MSDEWIMHERGNGGKTSHDVLEEALMNNDFTVADRQGTEQNVRQVAPALSGRFLSSFMLSLLTGIFLVGSLIYVAGPWNIIANTRLLNVLIKSGIIKYHDRDAGFIEGVADHSYYFKSQEPVDWVVIALVIIVLLLFWVLKAHQFHDLARYHAIPGSFAQHARAYMNGLTCKKFTPLHIGDMATAATLQANGAAPERVSSTLFLFRLFVLFEVVMYALFGLLGIGWTAWLLQMFWALVFLGVMYWWTRPASTPITAVSALTTARAHVRELLQRPARLTRLGLISLVAFGLEDVAAYLLTMAFSTRHVLLHVDFDILLMAFVAGYIARLIPLTPGGIGQFEWGFATALFLGGVGLPEAVTIALLYSVFYYLSFGLLYLVTLPWRGSQPSFRSVLNLVYHPLPAGGGQATGAIALDRDADTLATIPAVPLPHMPAATRLWSRGLIVAWIMLTLFFIDRLMLLLSIFWLLESMQFSTIFWTNFSMGATLFVSGVLAFMAGIALPAFLYPVSRQTRRFVVSIAGMVGLLAGYTLAFHYPDYLLWRHGLPVGTTDPIFGVDKSFYLFALPAWWITWWALAVLAVVTLMSMITCAHLSQRLALNSTSGSPSPTLLRWNAWHWLATIAGTPTLVAITGLGLVLAVGIWISRYHLLLQEDYTTSVFTGASYIDVNGLFSTLNHIRFTAVVMLGLTAATVIFLRTIQQKTRGRQTDRWPRQARLAGTAIVVLLVADFGFAGLVSIRETLLVTPNQPIVQLPYIQHHIDATRHAYGLADIEEIEFIPRHGDAPLPDLNQILNSNIIRNAPLWPTHVSYLEQVVDPQHAQRVVQTGGDTMIYGPSLEIFRQQEKLRTYYDFMDVDVLRYTIEGEKTLFVSAVRELPILEPQPWLAWWGQRFMLFTHGHGLVMAPVGTVTAQGEPIYVSSQIPVTAAWSEITATNQQVYYGEGNDSMAISNVRNMAELDYPTEQGRAEIVLPLDVPAGVHLDSLLKRIVFGWRSGELWEMIFSNLITSETRIHYYRQPLPRLQHIAPFLYFEANPYATIVDGDITWIVNAVTTSDHYPYSRHAYMGDKSHSRSPQAVRTERINYVEDAVKATMNATTGQVQLYQIADEPVINTWAAVYPSLFTQGDQLPAEVRQQLTYPLHLFHLQFDDLYIYYHMNDPMYFFNMEDMWDDADEVLGPLLDGGRAITFSMEPYHMLVETGGMLPAASEREQFAMTMVFTPEGARNLRAIPMAYQDGADYGRLFVLMVPKGLFITGPEQADAMIDQDPEISEQISWWNRLGNEVIRGHTSLLLIEDEIIYVEPIFIRSQQNAITQLKRVVVVVRGQPYMGETLEQALHLAYGYTPGILATSNP